MWIKVKDRMPEDGKFVVLRSLRGDLYIGERYGGEWYDVWEDAIEDEDVVAWLEIPEYNGG